MREGGQGPAQLLLLGDYDQYILVVYSDYGL